MHYGVTMFITDQTMGPVDVARAVEERGLDSMFLPEHTHIPVSRRTPYPVTNGPLPEEYKRILDPFVALAAAAAVTSRIRVGTGVCLVAQRDPIVTAKEVATLDFVSNGRFVFGVGTGWNEDEAEDHGIVFKKRRAIVRERLMAMNALWTSDEASFTGEHMKLPPSWAWPKPVQRPRPPIFFGGAATQKLFDLIAEVGDGWMPIGGAGVAAMMPELANAFERAKRDPKSARVTIYAAVPDAKKLAYYKSLGVGEVVMQLPPAGSDVVLPILDGFAALVREVG